MPVSPTDEDELPPEDGGKTTPSGEGESGNTSGSNNSSEGSPASETQDDNKPKNIADAVRAALDSGKEQSSGSGEGEAKPGETPDPKAAKPGEEEDLGELTDEELASYKGKTQRRFKQFQEQTKAQATEIAKLKPEAENFRRVQQFVTEANLTAEDVNTGMNIMKLMKNEPVKAYEVLHPIFTKLEALVGVRLPEDLQKQVTEGKITSQHAQELSRLRASNGLTAQQREQQQKEEEARTQRAQAKSVEKLKDDVGSAITDWETRWKASDPDYSLKHARVSEAIELELHRRISNKTLPTTVKDAVKMANEVKAKVEKELLKFAPRKQAINPSPQVPGSTNGSKPVAKTIHEAVAQAVGFK